MIYRLCIADVGTVPDAATTIDTIPGFSFLFVPEQPLYEQFKKAINDDTAQLENSDGVIMSQDDAKAFVATLP